MQVKTVNSETVSDILLGRAGLIVGPGVTVNATLYSSISAKFGIPDPERVVGLKSLGDALRAQSGNEEELREKVRLHYGEESPSPYLPTLARPNWKTVLSMTLDSYLEDRIQMVIDKKPSRKPLTVISDLTAQLPPRTTPAFKLFGSLSAETFALYEDEYLSSRVMWRYALAHFSDTLAGSPAICIGVDGDTQAFIDLTSEMLAAPNARPGALVFMQDSPLLQNRTFLQLVKDRVPTYAFQDSLSSLVSRISSQEDVGRTPMLRFPDKTDSLLERYRDVCVVVAEPQQDDVRSIPREALIDSLFSPSVPDWAPYTMDLDFRREMESELIELALRTARESQGRNSCIALTGSAANGKTTLLKRVAFEIARQRRVVIWITATPLSAPERFFHEFFRDLKSMNETASEVFVFVDDPIRSRSGEVETILGSAASLGFAVTLVVGVRSSEWSSIDNTLVAGHSTTVSDLVLPDDFSTDELQRLAAYLFTIGLAGTESEATKLLESAGPAHAKDVLNTLYVAVPNTRAVIVSSVRDEYCRLGDIGSLQHTVRGAYEYSSTIVRKAYEYTAVANTYGCDLPFEILRAAVGFEWSEAKDLLANNSAVWGVLYTISTDDGISLRARNQIVADTIVSLVNGGAHSRLGEIRVLHALIHACNDKSGLTYRNFIAKLLVGNSRLERLNYDDGRELYSAAIGALAAPDRTLVHHQGIWEDRHNHPSEALAIFKEALKTPNYPYTERRESESNIYTSMAASVLSQIRSGEKTLATGRAEAEELLERSREDSIGDAHSVHVGAGISLELVRALDKEDAAERLKIASAAVSDIDKLAILDDSPLAFRSRSKKSEGMLRDARESLYAESVPKGDPLGFAEEIWGQDKSQDGFIVVARQQLAEARGRGKGNAFMKCYEYILQCRTKVHEEGRYVDKRLLEIQAETFYWWRIHRAMLSALDIEIDWSELLTLLSEIGEFDSTPQRAFFQFLRGLALAHLDDWESANETFTGLRQSELPPHILWLPRAYLLNPKGGRRTVQGIVREHGGRVYLEVESLGQSFIVERRDRWNSPGETDHANVMFCFGGTRAVHDA